MDTEILVKEYNERTRSLRYLLDEARFRLDQVIKKEGIKVDRVIPRIKPLDSFLEKIKRKAYTDPFSQITDLVGLRVVCLFLSDIEPICKVIRKTFEVKSEENKMNDASTHVFQYMDVQFNLTLGHVPKESPFPSTKETIFEIQVRTIAQDAWAAVSHHLAYKKTPNWDRKLERDFYALCGLFYVADTHFQLLRDTSGF